MGLVDIASWGLLLAFLSSLCWAGFDIIRKQVGGVMTASAVVMAVMLGHIAIIAPFILVTEFAGSPDVGVIGEILFVSVPEMSANYWAISGASASLKLVANGLFLRAVQLSPLSLTTPYLAFTAVFSAIPAYVIHGEVPTSWGIAGILVVCLGAFFLNPGSSEHGVLAPVWALWNERGSLYMLAVAAIWSVTPTIDKSGAAMTSAMWHTMLTAGAVGVAFLLYRAAVDDHVGEVWDEVMRSPGLLVASAVFAVAAMVMQLASYEFVAIAYVETIKRAVGVVGAIVAGWLLFSESDIARRLIGAVVMAIGVAMIILGG